MSERFPIPTEIYEASQNVLAQLNYALLYHFERFIVNQIGVNQTGVTYWRKIWCNETYQYPFVMASTQGFQKYIIIRQCIL